MLQIRISRGFKVIVYFHPHYLMVIPRRMLEIHIFLDATMFSGYLGDFADIN